MTKWVRGHSPKSIKNLTNRVCSPLMQEKAREALLKNPLMQKDEKHCNARWWRIRSPKNIIYTFRNLREFVRTHEHLFDPIDVEWRPTTKGDLTCRACGGLSALSGRINKGTRGSWKGWTWVSQTERMFPDGFDYNSEEQKP